MGWDRPGVGWFVTGLVGAIAVTVVALTQGQDERPAPVGERAMRIVWAVLALGLLSAGGLRAAGWLFALCLPTAVICGALALAGGRSLRALVMAVLSMPIAVFRALPWASRGLAGVRGRTTSSGLRWPPRSS
jgi:hypothetical protein